jgi:GNAT superfamily N-acetyltransferase
MKIVRASIKDVKKVAPLFDAYRVFYGKDSDLDGATYFLGDRVAKDESVIFTAIDSNDDYCGFVQLYPIFSSTRLNRLWLLNDLFVSPSHRGKGISMLLIDAAKGLAKDTKSEGLILETAKDNIIGNELYPKAGFELDEDHNYYSWS